MVLSSFFRGAGKSVWKNFPCILFLGAFCERGVKQILTNMIGCSIMFTNYEFSVNPFVFGIGAESECCVMMRR